MICFVLIIKLNFYKNDGNRKMGLLDYLMSQEQILEQQKAEEQYQQAQFEKEYREWLDSLKERNQNDPENS